MTRSCAQKHVLRSVCLFLLATLLVGFGLLGSPAQTYACVCYDSEDKEQTVDGTDACNAACGDDEAKEVSSGVCECENGETLEMGCSGVCAAENLSEMTSAEAATAYEEAGYISPELQVDIPTVQFSEVLRKDGNLNINWIGEYITGVFTFLLSFGTIIAIVFIMIGGLQYAIAGGHGDAKKGKDRIRNAITGLVLLMCVYLILWTVNPNLTFFGSLSLEEVDEIELDSFTAGFEGAAFGSVSRDVCDGIVEQAKSEGTCNISQAVTSPTGNQPSCGNHHWFDRGANGDYKLIKNLDYGAGWGASVLAPFDGIVTYQKQTNKSNRCGNRIYLEGTGDAAGAKITICHAKDFVNDDGTVLEGTTVAQGDVIGHIGGNCCEGESPPSDWASAKYGWCNIGGEKCTDPNKLENCDCQAVEQAGNTSGPHVHMTWKSGGHLLACLDY